MMKSTIVAVDTVALMLSPQSGIRELGLCANLNAAVIAVPTTPDVDPTDGSFQTHGPLSVCVCVCVYVHVCVEKA